jgi:tetratricopeptide (TPR) repeat protein
MTILAAEPTPDPTPGEVVDRYAAAVQRLEEGRAAEAARALQSLLATIRGSAMAEMGPAYGNLLYHLGAALVETGDVEGAIDAWERCYTEFPNDPDHPARNEFHLAALVRWAKAEHARGHRRTAIKLYVRALKEGPDPAQQPGILLNLGYCLQELGDRERAGKTFLALLKRTEGRPEAEPEARRALVALAWNQAESGEWRPVERLLNEHQALLACPDAERRDLNAELFRIGRRCAFAGEPMLALRWYFYLADPPEDDRDEETERAILLARSSAFYQLNLFRLALPGYQVLAQRPASSRGAEVLHAAAICAAMLDRSEESGRYATELRTRFPSYIHLPEVLTAWVASLQRAGRQERALEAANDARQRLTLGSVEREGLDFAAASALYQLGRFEEAHRGFAAFLRDHPGSTQALAARYYQASATVHLQRWDEADARLRALAEAEPGNEFMDGILYHRALCAYMNDQPEAAIALIRDLLYRFQSSRHLADGLNLWGDAKFQRRQWDDADALYQRAATLADRDPDQREVAAYAWSQRVRIAAAQQQWSEVVRRFQEFRFRHGSSRYMPDAAVLAAQGYERLDNVNEALHLLHDQVMVYSDRVRDPGLPKLLQAHHAIYKRLHGYEALIRYLDAFPGPRPFARPLSAWLLIGKIEALESIEHEEQDPRLTQWYEQLTASFDIEELEDYVVLKTARWLDRRGQPDAAISYYTVLTDVRSDSPMLQQARVEISRLLGQSDRDADPSRALEFLALVERESQDAELLERALLEKARIRMRQEDWTAAAALWDAYLGDETHRIARAESNYQLAVCKDRLQQTDEAITLYLGTYVNYEGYIDWSSRAVLRCALIYAEHNRPAQALATLEDMMNRMGHLSHPIINKARTLHLRWKEEGYGVER